MRENAPMAPSEIEAIERATLAAVAPEALEEIPGWLLPYDSGTVGRAKSAVPTAHTAPDALLLREIEARYAARGLPAVLRIPSAAQFDELRDLLAHSGYAAERPTEVHTAAASVLAQHWDGAAAEVAGAPDAGWASVFLGEGFDPADGASRVRSLGRASGSLFCSVREDGRTVAAGAAAFGHGWASVHGMRTAQAARGRGHAARVLATLAAAARSRGYERVFLQVQADNAPALSLYRRAGFEHGWTYTYWRR